MVKAGAPAAGGRSLGAIPSPIDFSHDTGKKPIKLHNGFNAPEVYPAAYDLRIQGRVSAVKDQSTGGGGGAGGGACWAFSVLAAVESKLLLGESWDFSENNMKDTSGFDLSPCGGGNSNMATAYLTRQSGPWLEAADPYNTVENKQAPVYPSANRQKNIQEAIFLPPRSGSTDNDNIKQALISYGGVYTTIYWENPYYSASTHSYAYYGGSGINHAVTIVGWDDNYDKNLFLTPAAGNGAFIVKNSWGPGWGEDGYFYLSYYDTNIKYSTVYPAVDPTTAYDWIYQYDPLGMTTSGGFGSPSAWYANVFTSTADNIKLKAVSFYTVAMNTEYTVQIYSGVTVTPVTGTLLSTKSGTIPFTGYHTVTIDDPVPLSNGQKFSVVILSTAPGYNWPIPMEDRQGGYSTGATASAGESYISSDGLIWYDVPVVVDGNSALIFPNTNVTLKALTVDVPLAPANFSGAAQGASSITWTWGSVAGATQYKLYPSTGGAAITLTGTTLTQTNLSTNTAYGARVSAVHNSEEGSQAALISTFTLAAAPTGYALVSAATTTLTVQWGTNDNPAGTQYRLDYWTAGGSTASAQGTASSATVTGLTVSTTYYLQVHARNENNIFTASTSTLTAQTLPASPGSLAGVPQGASSITWTWGTVAGISQYNFYPSTGGAPIPLTAATITQTELSTNTAYGARVSAVNNSGEGPQATLVSTYTLAAAPTGYALISAATTTLTVQWGTNDNPAGTQYRLDYWTAGGSTASAQGALSSATLTGLTVSTTYYLQVHAGNENNIFTASTSTLTAQTLPASPGSLAGAPQGASSITWTWGTVAGISQYNFYPSTGGAPIPLTAATITQTELSTNTAYGARVSAVNNSGEGPQATLVSTYTLAAPPTGYALISAATTTLTVQWGANDNPAGTQYRLDYWAAGGSTASAQGALSSATISGLTSSTTYYLHVHARNSNNIFTASSSTLTTQTLPAPPTPPGGLTGTAQGASSITWTWNSIAGISQYNFYPSTGGAAIQLAAATITQTSLSTNTAYGARVSAVNSSGEGSQAALVSTYTLAAAPTGYSLVSAATTALTVQWGANNNPAGTQYRLDYWTAGGSTTSAQVTASSTTVTGLTVSTTYYLRVYARNSNNIFTASSNTITAQTLAVPPTMPAAFTGAAQGVSSITWTWNSVAGATQYNFYPSTGGAAIVITAATITQTSLATNTAYGARVSAANSGGESALATAVSTSTLAAAPASLALASFGISSATAHWAPNQNPAGTYFTLQLSTNNFSSVYASSRTLLSTAAFTSLLPDTTYYFRARAENGLAVATAYTPVLSTVTLAAAPSGMTLTLLSTSSLTAAWQRNSNPSYTQFELSFSTDNFSASISTPLPFSQASNVIQLNLAGLAMDATYFARVRARNGLGYTTAFSTAIYFTPASLNQAVDPSLQASLVFGDITLEIPPNSFTQALVVTLQTPGAFPADARLTSSLAGVYSGVEITTNLNLQPLKKLLLTLAYSPAQAAGLNESQFVIARYDPSRSVWVPYPSTPDPASNKVTALIDHLSLFQVMLAAPASTLSGANIKIFPNPVRPSRGQTMKFTGLPAGATIKIYTFQGELVRGLTADASGIAQWDGRNSANQPAASEVYLAFIKAGSDTKTLKIMVER